MQAYYAKIKAPIVSTYSSWSDGVVWNDGDLLLLGTALYWLRSSKAQLSLWKSAAADALFRACVAYWPFSSVINTPMEAFGYSGVSVGYANRALHGIS